MKNCFNEKEIIKYIKNNGQNGSCPYCGSNNVLTMTTDKVGTFVRMGVKRAYEHLEEGTGAIFDSEEKRFTDSKGESAGSSLVEILIDEWNIFSSITQATILLNNLINDSAPSQRSIQQGEVDEFPDIYDTSYVFSNDLYGVGASDEYWAWENFKNLTMYYNRFFDVDDDKEGRDRLLKSVSKVFSSMSEILKKQNILYRARKIEEKMVQNVDKLDYYKEISPAPSIYATTNRMSPAGISYTYLATDIDTCYKECRMCTDDYAIVGTFKTRKDLRILNLSSTNYLYIENSMFSEDYEQGLTWINEFIHIFTLEISKIIDPKDKELEYVPTQVLAEYIRKMGYDGIKFESSVNKGSFNYVLFCGPNKDISREYYPWKPLDVSRNLIYFTKWLKLCDIKITQILTDTHEEKEIFCMNKIHRKDLNTEIIGHSEFNCIEEVQERINKIENLLKNEYKELLVNGIPFSLTEYVSRLLDLDNEQEHSLWVDKNLGWINIIIDKEKFDFEDKRGGDYWF